MDTWTVFGQMKSQLQLTEGFLNQHLVFSARYFFISTEISPDTLPKIPVNNNFSFVVTTLL